MNNTGMYFTTATVHSQPSVKNSLSINYLTQFPTLTVRRHQLPNDLSTTMLSVKSVLHFPSM